RFPIHASAKDAYLNELYADQKAPVFHTSIIGFQSHFTSLDRLQFGLDRHFDLLRLGLAKADLKETEPLLRDADLIGFNLSSLSSVEFPAVQNPNPSGFSIEELCRMCRYAGMSDKLKGLSLMGYEATEDRRGESALAVAQMIWYFMEGFYNRKNDFPISTDGLVEYIVDFKQLDYQLTFWKSQKTGRWWMQVPADVKDSEQRHRLVPCSYSDYQMATNQELPQRLINAFHRFGL
ncbi:MAG: arginase, partial [Bacteroidota bacterium]